ncbi:hypothetical protein pipiens_016673, partial [Culex pipiens pipiens]
MQPHNHKAGNCQRLAARQRALNVASDSKCDGEVEKPDTLKKCKKGPPRSRPRALRKSTRRGPPRGQDHRQGDLEDGPQPQPTTVDSVATYATMSVEQVKVTASCVDDVVEMMEVEKEVEMEPRTSRAQAKSPQRCPPRVQDHCQGGLEDGPQPQQKTTVDSVGTNTTMSVEQVKITQSRGHDRGQGNFEDEPQPQQPTTDDPFVTNTTMSVERAKIVASCLDDFQVMVKMEPRMLRSSNPLRALPKGSPRGRPKPLRKYTRRDPLKALSRVQDHGQGDLEDGPQPQQPPTVDSVVTNTTMSVEQDKNKITVSCVDQVVEVVELEQESRTSRAQPKSPPRCPPRVQDHGQGGLEDGPHPQQQTTVDSVSCVDQVVEVVELEQEVCLYFVFVFLFSLPKVYFISQPKSPQRCPPRVQDHGQGGLEDGPQQQQPTTIDSVVKNKTMSVEQDKNKITVSCVDQVVEVVELEQE